MLNLDRLRDAITRSGKTRKYLCAKLGKPQYYLTNVFRRTVPPDAEDYDYLPPALLETLAAELGTTVGYLTNETDDPRRPPHQTPPAAPLRVPVYGRVAAGIPIDAITDIEDYEELSPSMASTGEYAALRIHGDSMEPRIMDGDTVIVRLQDTADTGDVAIVMINGGEATCKRIKRMHEGVMLVPTNPRYEPMFYTNDEIESLPVTVWGKVIEVRGKI